MIVIIYEKIYVLVGVVLFFILVIMCWVFLGNFFDYTRNLGEVTEDLVDEKSKFIGVWEIQFFKDDDRFVSNSGIYIFRTDGTGSISGIESTWDIIDKKLVVHYYDGVVILNYDYFFSNDEKILTLTNSNGEIVFIRK